MIRFGRGALFLLTISFLAACAGSPRPHQQVEAAVETAEPETTVASLSATPEPAPEPAPAPPPVPDTQSFLRLSGVEITEILGKPGFVRKDPPAELWQYRTGRCTLDLFFYDEGGGAYALAYLDFRGTDGTSAGRDDCLREILDQRIG